MRTVSDILFRGKDVVGGGEIGIEIEMEGSLFPLGDLDKWRSEADGSLRGDREEDSREFVLKQPCKRKDSLGLLNRLEDDLDRFGSAIIPSFRTGVHVHINVRQLTFNQVFNFIFAFYMFEDVLTEFCGKDRVGSLFCLRARDAEGVTDQLAKAIKNKDLENLHTDDIRYSAMNLKAIKEYGSIEFRGLSFDGDFQRVEAWIRLLLAVKDFSLTFDNPKELVALLSKQGGAALAEQVFGDTIHLLPKVDWNVKLLRSIRLVQRLVYLSDWEEKEVETFIVVTPLQHPPVKKQQKRIQL